MDILDRYQEEIERRQALHAKGRTLEASTATRADEEQKVRHQITIIGCIRGVDGWYRCGFDEERKAIVPLELLEKAEHITKTERGRKQRMNKKIILDACCGCRMFWFDKHHPNVIYMDHREIDEMTNDKRRIHVSPDIKGDFRKMPFPDASFRMVVMDPPHLKRAGDKSWLTRKYGKLNPETWQDDLRAAFQECFRVLIPGGFLVFKWNEDQIRIIEVVRLSPEQPLFGQQHGKTHWLVFMKPDPELIDNPGIEEA